MLTEKLELMLSVIDKPKDAIETVMLKKQPAFSILIFLLANLSVLVSYSIDKKLGGDNFILKYLLFIAFNAVVLLVIACLFHFMAELFKGKGDVIALYSLLNFSLTPLLLLIPVAILSRFIGSDAGFVLNIFLYCWSLGFVAYAVEKLYKIPPGIAVAVVFSPVMIALLALFLIFIVSIGGFIALFL